MKRTYFHNQLFPVQVANAQVGLGGIERNENGISPKLPALVHIAGDNTSVYKAFDGIIRKLANVESIEFGATDKGLKGLVGKDEVSLEYRGWEMKKIDNSEIEKEIKYLEGFLISVDAKLNNEKFMANAKPELIEKEQHKKADALSKINSLKQQLG